MADVTIDQLPIAATIDATQDLLPIYTASLTATQAITRDVYLGITGSPVGTSDSQTLTNKTLTSPTVSSPTLSGTLSGTYTIGGTPTFPSSVATLTGSQTLTNKTLTSPTINSPTITNATISADTLSGFTVSNNGTVYGMSVAGGILASAALVNTVNNAALQTNAVGGSNLSTSAITLGYAQITSPFTTSTVSANVAVTGLSVAVTVPSGGRNVKITAYCPGIKTSAVAGTLVNWTILEGTTTLGTTLFAEPVTAYYMTGICVAYVSAPSPGSHTYFVATGQAAAGTVTVGAGTANPAWGNFNPAFILVEAI